MRLVKQLVEMKLKKYEEGLMNNSYNFWDFYMAYNLASAVLGKTPDMGVRNKLLRQIIMGKNVDDNKLVLSGLVSSDMNIVHEFLTMVETQTEKEVAYTDIYRPKEGIIGILEYDME